MPHVPFNESLTTLLQLNEVSVQPIDNLFVATIEFPRPPFVLSISKFDFHIIDSAKTRCKIVINSSTFPDEAKY